MHVGIDVTWMYTDFGGRGLYSFGDTDTLKNGQISLSAMDSNGHQKIKSIGIGSKKSCM